MTNVRVTLCMLRVDNVTILADNVTFVITLLKAVLAINGIDTNQFKAHPGKLTHPEQRQCQHLHVIYQFKTLSREWAGAINKLVRNSVTSLTYGSQGYISREKKKKKKKHN